MSSLSRNINKLFRVAEGLHEFYCMQRARWRYGPPPARPASPPKASPKPADQKNINRIS